MAHELCCKNLPLLQIKYTCKLNFYLAESPNDDLESSFPNEEGLMMAVKEEIPQPSKQTSLSPSTTQVCHRPKKMTVASLLLRMRTARTMTMLTLLKW